MKTFTSFAIAASVLAQAVHGHCKMPQRGRRPKTTGSLTLHLSADIFQYLTANGVKGGQYQNVRQNTNNNSPVTGKS